MGSLAITAPILPATFTYAFRETGGAWSAEFALVRGVNAPTRNFLAPACDELRITMTTPGDVVLERIHLCGLNISAGLTFEVAGGATTDTIPQTTPTRPRNSHRQTLRRTGPATDTHTLTITGIGQQNLNILDMVWGGPPFYPSDNYEQTSPFSFAPTQVQLNAGSSAYLKTKYRNGYFNAKFVKVERENFLDLEYLITHTLGDNTPGLVELNSTSDEPRDTFIANIELVGEATPATNTLVGFMLRLGEKHAQ